MTRTIWSRRPRFAGFITTIVSSWALTEHQSWVEQKNHGEHGGHGEKVEKALWKKGSANLLTKFIPVFPVIPVVGPLLSSTQLWGSLIEFCGANGEPERTEIRV